MTSSLFVEKVNSSHVTSSPCDEFTASRVSYNWCLCPMMIITQKADLHTTSVEQTADIGWWYVD